MGQNRYFSCVTLAQWFLFPLISRHWKQTTWGKGEGWGLKAPHWGWGRMEKSGDHIFWWVGGGQSGRENKTHDCHLSSQISLMPSSLLPPSHGESAPFIPPLLHQPQPSQVSMTSYNIPFPSPSAQTGLKWLGCTKLLKCFQWGFCSVQLNLTQTWTKKPHTGLIP